MTIIKPSRDYPVYSHQPGWDGARPQSSPALAKTTSGLTPDRFSGTDQRAHWIDVEMLILLGIRLSG